MGKKSKRNFTIKASCKGSKVRETRKMTVILKTDSGKVISGTCDCSAGKLRHCNISWHCYLGFLITPTQKSTR